MIRSIIRSMTRSMIRTDHLPKVSIISNHTPMLCTWNRSRKGARRQEKERRISSRTIEQENRSSREYKPSVL